MLKRIQKLLERMNRKKMKGERKETNDEDERGIDDEDERKEIETGDPGEEGQAENRNDVKPGTSTDERDATTSIGSAIELASHSRNEVDRTRADQKNGDDNKSLSSDLSSDSSSSGSSSDSSSNDITFNELPSSQVGQSNSLGKNLFVWFDFWNQKYDKLISVQWMEINEKLL